MNERQLEFVTAVIGCLANRLQLKPSDIYNTLKKHAIISGYLVPAYDVLHTFSRDYIADDVIDFMKMKGIEIC